MQPLTIIEQYYKPQTPIYKMLVSHSKQVAAFAENIARQHPQLGIDRQFVYEAAMLHDIGIYLTHAPDIHCYGTAPYLAHGYLGAEILLRHHLPRHALVCERHTGTGLSKQTIIEQNLPLPHRDMLPQSIEEQLICFADCFFSKSKVSEQKTPEQVRNSFRKFGDATVRQFDIWCEMFGC